MRDAEEIKTIIENIIESGLYVFYTDAGNGSGGPGSADTETLQEMLTAGDFNDAEQVEYDPEQFWGVYGLIANSTRTEFDANPTEWI